MRLRFPFARARRWLFGMAVLATTALGVAMMAATVQAQGITGLEVAILVLFAPTFAWITVAFWNAVVGFVLLLLGRDPLSLEPVDEAAAPVEGPLESRTAVVMPAYREDPARLVRGLGAVARSLARTGRGEAFDLYLLSDTPDAGAAEPERAAWARLRDELEATPGAPRLFYRRRVRNEGRKAGNIEEFCRRWGGRYDFMVVLDADSVMTGETLVELAATMEANPEVGLLQTVPLPARQETLFGRLLQFASGLYSRMLAAGMAFWQTDAGNYWGHNAILRVRAFMEECRLPVLPGRPPLGGPILSHDFVEAALLRRGGWTVALRALAAGSWEEVPGNVLDYARRDRRWAQGSLQHLRLLTARGLHPLSRLHLFLGAMGYVASLLWLLVLLAGWLYVAAPGLSAEPLATGAGWLAPFAGLNVLVSLLGATAVLLFLPKALGIVLALRGGAEAWGGRLRLVVSGAGELLFSVVLAPVMMVYHAAFVVGILAGRDVRWTPQEREGRRIPWPEAWRRTAPVTAVGVAWATATLWVSPVYFLWLLPILTGLVLAAPLVRWSSSRRLGRLAREAGLFVVPWEAAPPPELRALPATPAEVPAPVGLFEAADPSSATPDEAPLPMPAQILHPRRGPRLREAPR